MARGRALATFGALAAAALLPACGAEKGSKARPALPQAGTVRVQLTDMKIDPANPVFAKPGEVRFKVRNAGRETHALRIEGPPPMVMVETTDLRRGDSETVTADLNKAGRYTWYCPYHR